MRRLVTVGLVLVLCVAAVTVIAKNFHRQPAGPGTGSPNTTNPGGSASPGSPANTVPSQAGSKPLKLKPDQRDVVAAAALADAGLSAAQLMPAVQLRQVVDKQVVPANRAATIKVYRAIGPVLAKAWGYQSVQEAQIRGDYYIVTQKFKILRLKSNRASVALYSFTHFRTSRDWDTSQEHWDATITDIDLQRVGGRWLYVDAHDPPAADRPVAEVGLSFEQTKQHWSPYLGGFKNYANLE